MTSDSPDLSFERDGCTVFKAALTRDDVEALRLHLEPSLTGAPGRRITGSEPLSRLLAPSGPVGSIAANLIGSRAQPVRAVVFDKTAETNWSVAWHQDRTVAVRDRIDVEGYGPWSVKDGVAHVAPPIAILEKMATLRIHLDDCEADNAPLKVALGSHRLGHIAAADAVSRAAGARQLLCLGEAGDVWAYRTLILHASAPSAAPRHRRVLQIDYSAGDLDGGLRWRGLD